MIFIHRGMRRGYMNAQDETPSSLVGMAMGALSLIKSSAPPAPASEPFKTHPLRPTCILLPLFDFMRANMTFLNVVIADDEFWTELLSFGSYLFSHASASKRALAYARIMLSMLIVLVEEGGLLLSQKERAVGVRFCRQVSGPGPSVRSLLNA